MADMLLNLLGIARRAGCLAMGSHAATAALKTGRANLMLLSCDLSERSRRSLSGLCEARDIPWRTLSCDMEALSHAVGAGAGCLTVNDDGFAKKMMTLTTPVQGECLL